MVTVINPNSSDFWRKFYEIVSPDIDKFFTYYCSYSETCFDIYYKGKLLNSLIFNKHHNQFEWVDDEKPITFWGCDKEIKISILNTFKQLLGGKASYYLYKSLKLVTPTSISKEQVCERYPECMNCPLKWGSRNCEELEQNEINDIMYIVEVVERRTQTPFHKFGMSKEIMARLRARLIWNVKD